MRRRGALALLALASNDAREAYLRPEFPELYGARRKYVVSVAALLSNRVIRSCRSIWVAFTRGPKRISIKPCFCRV
jgi:hypothetical protein